MISCHSVPSSGAGHSIRFSCCLLAVFRFPRLRGVCGGGARKPPRLRLARPKPALPAESMPAPRTRLTHSRPSCSSSVRARAIIGEITASARYSKKNLCSIMSPMEHYRLRDGVRRLIHKEYVDVVAPFRQKRRLRAHRRVLEGRLHFPHRRNPGGRYFLMPVPF